VTRAPSVTGVDSTSHRETTAESGSRDREKIGGAPTYAEGRPNAGANHRLAGHLEKMPPETDRPTEALLDAADGEVSR